MSIWKIKSLCPNCSGVITFGDFVMRDTMSWWNWLRQLLKIPQLIVKTTEIWRCKKCGRESIGKVFE